MNSFIVFKAIKNGNVNRVRNLLSQSRSNTDEDRMMYLHRYLRKAINYGQVNITRMLIEEYQAPIHFNNNTDRNFSIMPIHKAVKLGNIALVNLLLQHGANPNQRDEKGQTPLFYIEDLSPEIALAMIAILIKYRSKPDMKDYIGESVLHKVSRKGNHVIIEALIQSGLSVDIKSSKNKNTALHVACAHVRIDAAFMLIKYSANVNSKNYIKQTPLHEALGAIKNVKNASQIKNLVELLVKNGADVNAQDEGGNTPLHVMVKSTSSRNPDVLPPGYKKIVEILFEAGANIFIENRKGNTPSSIIGTSPLARRIMGVWSNIMEIRLKHLYNAFNKHFPNSVRNQILSHSPYASHNKFGRRKRKRNNNSK